MFIDEIDLILRGGDGGAGKVAFNPGKKSGPSGGNGGRGGNLYIQATSDLTALKKFTVSKVLSAEGGSPGESNKKTGKNGKDLIVTLPLGSVLIDQKTKEQLEIIIPNDKILVCKGGLGGRGNFEFKSPRNTTPMYAQPGLPGEERQLHVSLKLIAQYGLIGLPNSGKSSLLNELTNTNVKTSDYPFTTLEPNLGVLNGTIIADIPGLIEGASSGKGLGIKFLKHIEKTSKLLHCISLESCDVLKDYQVVIEELKKFNQELLKKPQIILLTKSDLVTKEQLRTKINLLKRLKQERFPVSIYDFDSIENLKKLLKAV